MRVCMVHQVLYLLPLSRDWLLEMLFWNSNVVLQMCTNQHACKILIKVSLLQMATNVNMKDSQLRKPIHHHQTLIPCVRCANWLKVSFVDLIWVTEWFEQLWHHIYSKITLIERIIKRVQKNTYNPSQCLRRRL